MSAAAKEKRKARKRKTLAWERAFFTTTKVAPQRRVQRTRAKSALRDAGWEVEEGELMCVRRCGRASEWGLD
jgi:hypothetical protein